MSVDGELAVAEPSLLTIVGATGDLTRRLLLPSLLNLISSKVLPDGFVLLGAAQEDWPDDKFRDHVRDALKEFWGDDADPKLVKWLMDRTFYQSVDFGKTESFDGLSKRVAELQKQQQGASNNAMFYLATAPKFIASIAEQLGRVGLLNEDHGWRRLVVEKPFGHDYGSAVQLTADLHKTLREDQIYRIDHFVGKDAVQDVVAFRFANTFAEPLFDRSLIAHVQITVSETVGLEGRAGYYETSGAMRDMIPNHLAELLSLIAMDPPISLSPDHIHAKQVEVLESVRQIQPEEIAKYVVRGQYAAGTAEGKQIRGYLDEPDVKPGSATETYVAMQLEVDNWRWAGVPFYLRTGKSMTAAETSISVVFQDPAKKMFTRQGNSAPSDRLLFRFRPSPGLELSFAARSPGLQSVVDRQKMTFKFAGGPFGDHAKGYERPLYDVMLGSHLLFQKSEFVEAGWKMVQPLLDAWTKSKKDLETYPAGSAGPAGADDLLSRNGHEWMPLGAA